MDEIEIFRREILDFYHATAKHDGGWRRVGRILGTSGGAALQIATGRRPPTAQHLLRWVRSDHSCLILSHPCPTCLRLHDKAVNHADGLDCRGAPIERVVALAPGETIKRPPLQSRRRKPMYRPVVDLEIGEVCKRNGLDVNEILRDYLAARGLLSIRKNP